MDQVFRFSGLAAQMQPSPIRELFKMIQRPGMISFAGGLPDPAVFPVEAFASCANVLSRDGIKVLQYGASEGYEPLRESLVDLMQRQVGVRPEGDELLITSGSQQAVDLVGRALLDPGDVVIVEAPTYPGTLHSLRNAGGRFATVACDGDGMLVDTLPDIIRGCESETGKRPKLIYSVPTFSNPSGACLTLERRRRLLDIAAEFSIPIFEDDPYGRLRFSGEPVPALRSLAADPSLVIYASSFSKILAPGVRVAWTVADPKLIRAMVLMRQGEDLCTSTVTQALVAEYCARGLLEAHLEKVISTYAVKCAAMQTALEQHVDRNHAEWVSPQGGFFFWMNLIGRDSQSTFLKAVEDNIAFVPGHSFFPDRAEQVGEVHEGSQFARLCFTFADPQQIDEGCQRFGRVLAEKGD